MSKEKVSVIISTRNRPKYLEHTINSILANSYADFEVIIVDQSDNGRTQVLVDRFAQTNSKIRYFRTSSRGLGTAKNFGIKKYQGTIVAFTDDDCAVHSDWIENMVLSFRQNPEAGIVFGSVLPPPGYKTSDGFVPVFLAKDSLLKGVFSKVYARGIGANMAVKKEVIEKVGSFDEMLGTGAALPGNVDYDYSYRTLMNGFKIFDSSSVKVIHLEVRKWGKEAMDKLKQYELSRLAVYMKYIRYGDWRAFFVMFLEIFVKIFQLIKGSNYIAEAYTRPRLFVAICLFFNYVCWWSLGIARSLKFRVDKKRCIYYK
ncbi:glycosyltransferase family 2 protein [Candidatus Omnitrophota bacterium]